MNIDYSQPTNCTWLRVFPLVLAVTSSLHWSGFYYSHDVPKWLVIDILLCTFIFTQRRYLSIDQSLVSLLFISVGYLMVSSIFWASHQYASIEFVLRFVLFGLSFSILNRAYTHAQRITLLIHSSVASSIVFSIAFLIERVIGLHVSNGAFTPIGFTNNAGHIFNIWLPALFFYLFRKKHPKTTLLPTLFAISVLLYVLQISNIRTTMVGLILSSLALVAIYLARSLYTRRYAFTSQLKLSLFIVLSLCISLFAINILGTYSVSSPKNKTQVLSQLSTITTSPVSAYQPRLNMLMNSWDMLIDNPLGVGINNFEYHHPAYAKVGEKNASNYINERQILRTPHNFIVKMYTEIGWVGGTLFLLMYAWLVIQTLKFVWKKPMHGWVLIATSTFLLHSLMSQVFLSPLSYIFAILLFSCLTGHKESEPLESNNLMKGVSYLMLFVPMYTIITLTSHYYHHSAGYNIELSKLKKSAAIYPGNDRALLSLSQAYYQRHNDKESALITIKQFLALNPEHIYGRYYFAQLLLKNQQCEQAIYTLARLLSHYPSYADATRLIEESANCQAKQNSY
ncbi:O-antigen ligase family protein [Vibrio kyushuensis]|uniref:O-antigen ligase family protein n=1 Tax=Vibrio kyushuensis TaxID=2910249 RepID=UPI003D09774F